jgi:hypothetical protein
VTASWKEEGIRRKAEKHFERPEIRGGKERGGAGEAGTKTNCAWPSKGHIVDGKVLKGKAMKEPGRQCSSL